MLLIRYGDDQIPTDRAGCHLDIYTNYMVRIYVKHFFLLSM